MLAPEDWPDELDAVIAAPQNHVLVFENEAVRVLDITVAPGETVPLHTHRWPGILYLLSWSASIRRDAEGSVMMDSRTAPPPAEKTAFWSPALGPHTLENVGTTELHVLGIELKRV